VASGGFSDAGPEAILAVVVDGLGDNVDEGIIGNLIRFVQTERDRAWRGEDFRIARLAESKSQRREAWITIHGAFVEVAREAWESGDGHPARTMLGLNLVYRAAEEKVAPHGGKGKKNPPSLLSCIEPGRIEQQVSRECSDFMGVKVPRAHIMLDAHGSLARWAGRQGLMTEGEVSDIERKVDQIRTKIG
jgi:hypothetical protein